MLRPTGKSFGAIRGSRLPGDSNDLTPRRKTRASCTHGPARLGSGAWPARAERPPRGNALMSRGLERMSAMGVLQTVLPNSKAPFETTTALMRELVSHLREQRTQLREEWLRRIFETELLTAMTREEVFAEATSVYDSYVEALETRTLEALQAYAQNLSERIIPRGVETNEVVGIVLLLRDVLARSLFAKYHANFELHNAVLDAYEPAANSIAITVAVGFVRQRERIIRDQQE